MKVLLDQVKIETNGVIQIRQITDNDEYHRLTLFPTNDVSNFAKEIQDICNQTWTPEIIAAYKFYIDSLPTKMGAA